MELTGKDIELIKEALTMAYNSIVEDICNMDREEKNEMMRKALDMDYLSKHI